MAAKLGLGSRIKLRALRWFLGFLVRRGWRAGVPAVASARDQYVPGPGGDIPVRIYTPNGAGQRLPVLVYFHGGGFVIGDLETHDPLCRDLAARNACMVVNVAFRLAPEHPFPAAPEDALAALRWVAENAASFGGDPARIVGIGDSAGGGLVAAAAQVLAKSGGPSLKGQVLIYPVLDYHTPATPSYIEYAKRQSLSRDLMVWFWELYLQSVSQIDDYRATPLRNPDLAGLPPALILTAEFDVLRDEAERYAERLKDAGIPTRMTRYPGQDHGFVGLNGPTAVHDQAMTEIQHWLKQLPL